MKRLVGTLLSAVLVLGSGGLRAADAKDATAILDKAIKALGGEEKLSKVKAVTWKSKGKLTFGDTENPFTAETTVAGLDYYHSEFAGEFGGNAIKGVTVVALDKGWRKFGDMSTEMDKDALANEKRTVYLQLVPALIVPLKGKDFKVETAGEEKVGDKPAAVVKVVGPDRKDFKLFFDKESGLPVKLVAKVISFTGDEFTQETTFADYKDFGGIKRATTIHTKRNGEKFVDQQISDFKALDEVKAKLFAEPKQTKDKD